MLKLRTVYPYALSDRVGDEYKKENTYVCVGNKFPPIPRKHNRISRGTCHKKNNSLSPDEFLIKMKHDVNLSNVPYFYRVSPLVMNEYNLEILLYSFKII